MITAEINRQELDKLMKRIERLAAIDTTKRKEIRNEARKIARNNYIAALKVSIQDYPRTIVVVRDGTRIVIPPGTLRRSLGTWTPKDAKARIAAGPRAGQFRKMPNNRDGWFAHFVEFGNFPDKFGGKHRTTNTGVFQNAMQQTSGKMRREMIDAMRNIIRQTAR
jgi:hypothetical protein